MCFWEEEIKNKSKILKHFEASSTSNGFIERTEIESSETASLKARNPWQVQKLPIKFHDQFNFFDKSAFHASIWQNSNNNDDNQDVKEFTHM